MDIRYKSLYFRYLQTYYDVCIFSDFRCWLNLPLSKHLSLYLSSLKLIRHRNPSF